MLRFTTVWATALILSSAPAVAEPFGEIGRAFNPVSRTATAITGPVIASENRLVFETGGTLELSLASASVSGSWTPGNAEHTAAQVFTVSGDAGPLRNDNKLCGGQPVRYVVAHEIDLLGTSHLGLVLFSDEDQPRSFNSQGLCGSYTFSVEPTSPQPIPKATPAASADTPRAEDPGDWELRRSSNPIDDTPTVVMSLPAESGGSRFGNRIRFIARCQSNTTEAYAVWHDYVGDDSNDVYDEWKWVEVRIGEAPSERQRWGVSTDRQATFAPSWAGNLLKRMVGEDRLILRVVPYGESPVTAIFDIRGMEGPLRELSETCSWSF